MKTPKNKNGHAVPGRVLRMEFDPHWTEWVNVPQMVDLEYFDWDKITNRGKFKAFLRLAIDSEFVNEVAQANEDRWMRGKMKMESLGVQFEFRVTNVTFIARLDDVLNWNVEADTRDIRHVWVPDEKENTDEDLAEKVRTEPSPTEPARESRGWVYGTRGTITRTVGEDCES